MTAPSKYLIIFIVVCVLMFLPPKIGEYSANGVAQRG
jgi:hypothetical protein